MLDAELARLHEGAAIARCTTLPMIHSFFSHVGAAAGSTLVLSRATAFHAFDPPSRRVLDQFDLAQLVCRRVCFLFFLHDTFGLN